MNNQKRIMKALVIVILAVFLLSSGLVSVMYFVDMNSKVAQQDTGSVETGVVAESGFLLSGTVGTGK